jgi:hypothetical protein
MMVSQDEQSLAATQTKLGEQAPMVQIRQLDNSANEIVLS